MARPRTIRIDDVAACIMAPAPRERTIVDLRGLGPALRAHARARNLTVSDVARIAVAAVLETAALAPQVQTSAEPDAAARRPVKLTIRLRLGVADRLTTRARACGLSNSAYLTTLIDETPAPPLAVATALGTSTEQLAVVSADLNELIRMIGRGSVSSSLLIDERTRTLMDDVRRHVGLASRLVSEPRPARKRAASERSCQ
jgi:post-segregation antitoxin (ccd killing protein)